MGLKYFLFESQILEAVLFKFLLNLYKLVKYKEKKTAVRSTATARPATF